MNTATQLIAPLLKTPQNYQTYRIRSDATNRFAIVFDPILSKTSLMYCVEIFDVGGKTLPNHYQMAVEMLFVLKGEGVVTCGGISIDIHTGDSILVPLTGLHRIENQGVGRLYLLTIMVPDEELFERIRSGIPVALDEEDIAVLQQQT